MKELMENGEINKSSCEARTFWNFRKLAHSMDASLFHAWPCTWATGVTFWSEASKAIFAWHPPLVSFMDFLPFKMFSIFSQISFNRKSAFADDVSILNGPPLLNVNAVHVNMGGQGVFEGRRFEFQKDISRAFERVQSYAQHLEVMLSLAG